ncbi:MAG TPA: hypothetical protein VH062_27595, partial [Polyangiaceae bacterium]|nr:hypothetical protein [Polyangiaceae bacterium]
VTVTIWVEAMGLDVIDDMIASTYLDASVRSAIQRFPVILASAQPGPTPDNRPVTFEWTLAKATDTTTAYHVMGQTCVENTNPLFVVTPLPAGP